MIAESPLAFRVRPDSLEEFVGQDHIIGKDTFLYRAVKANRLTSVIFYGPSGTGKTTLAKIIANKMTFVQLNATTSGVKDIKHVVEEAKTLLAITNQKTVLFIDEIHRFNKSQQDTLLPHVEDGTLILIGATTENPYFEVNKALLSRSTILQLHPLTPDHIKTVVTNAIHSKKGLGYMKITITDDALDFVANISNGDARSALNAIELAVLTTEMDDTQTIALTLPILEQCIQKRAIQYDKSGDNHYDTISAFIKSMRGSDPDAALYYLARMLYAGEDPKFIARRIVICASEDVGNADPHALQVAVAAAQATDFIGMPESRIILAQAVTYVSCAPKSNSAVISIDSAMKDVQNIQTSGVPIHLKYCHYEGVNEVSYEKGYKYAHDFPGHYVKQQYLPDELVGKIYYEPSDNGVEKKIKASLERLRSF